MIAWLGGLSPRRRVFAAGVTLLVVAGGCAAAVAVIAGSGQAAGHPAQDRPGQVLLVPGYGGSTQALGVLASRIQAAGRMAAVLQLPGNGTGSLIRDAAALDAAVNRALRAGAPSVDVIGYSAGGVTALLWARDDDGDRKARRVITLGSPFHGTRVASSAEGFAPDACPAACQQLVPGSSVLAGVAAGVPSGVRWLSLWTTDDATVTPPDSARLAGAINVPIQSLCPRQRITHSELPTSPVVTTIVLQAIGPGPIDPAAATACRS
jgi:triacylglycerol lipase